MVGLLGGIRDLNDVWALCLLADFSFGFCE